MNMFPTQRGFSLVEILVALVVGMFVVLGVTQVFTATYRANTAAIQSTNLNQQLRATANIISREIRRSGFWDGSILDVKNGTSANPFFETAAVDRLDADLAAGTDGVDDCFLYGYDADEDGLATDANEWRGFRIGVDADTGRGVVQAKVSDAGASAANTTGGDCSDATAAGGWQALTDPQVIDITTLSFDYDDSQAGASVPVLDDCPASATESRIYVRTVQLSLTGALAGDPNISRTVNTMVRLRNDRVVTGVAIPGGC